MYKSIGILGICLLFTHAAQGEVVEFPLPDLNGTFDTDFSNHTLRSGNKTPIEEVIESFTSIDHISLRVSATVTPDVYRVFDGASVYGSYLRVYPGFEYGMSAGNFGVNYLALLSEDFIPASGSLVPDVSVPITPDISVYPFDIGPLVWQDEHQIDLDLFLYGYSRLDDRGTVDLFLLTYGAWIGSRPPAESRVVYANVEITDVVLIIEGTAVPEPASVGILMIGGLVALRRRR